MPKCKVLTILLTIAVPPALAVDWKVSTETTAGINDKLDTNGYISGDTKFELTQKMSEGTSIRLEHNLAYDYYRSPNHPDNHYRNHGVLEFQSADIKSALHYGKTEKGASRAYFDKPDGMRYELTEYKNEYNSVSLLNEINDFKIGYSQKNLDNDENEWSMGLGYDVAGWSLGAGYDNAAIDQEKAFGVSAKYEQKIGDVKNKYNASYVRQIETGGTSLGLGLESEINEHLALIGKYAHNQPADEENYDYFNVGTRHKYDNFEGGSWIERERDENLYGVWARYETEVAKIESEVKVKKDDASGGNIKEANIKAQYKFDAVAPEGTMLLAGYKYERNQENNTGGYVAAEFGITKEVTAGLSYSETNESGPNDYFFEGTSLYLRAKF